MNTDWKKLAEHNTILRCQIGSEAYGINLEGSSDRDEKGVCIEPVEAAMGFSSFDQYIYRSAAEREGKHDAKSQAGDLDLTIYSLRKFIRLAMQGNPDVTELLFHNKYLKVDPRGRKLQELAPHIISKHSGKRFMGYLESQRQRLLGEIGQKKVNRPELEEKYGYDTKYAVHIVRLGFQGVELMQTGRLTLPLPTQEREYCLGVRKGEIDLQEVLTKVGDLKREVEDLIQDGPMPDEPNFELVEDWMINTYWQTWRAQRVLLDRLEFNLTVS